MITRQTRSCPSCQSRFTSRRELATHRREAHRPTRLPGLIRLGRALRAMHQSQVYAMECLLRLSQPPEPDTMTWVQTHAGYSLAGRCLPGPIEQPSGNRGNA